MEIFLGTNLCYGIGAEKTPPCLQRNAKGPWGVLPKSVGSAGRILAWKTHNDSLKGVDLNSWTPSGSTVTTPFKSHPEQIPSSSYDWILSLITHFLLRCFRIFSFLYPLNPLCVSLKNIFPWFFFFLLTKEGNFLQFMSFLSHAAWLHTEDTLVIALKIWRLKRQLHNTQQIPNNTTHNCSGTGLGKTNGLFWE